MAWDCLYTVHLDGSSSSTHRYLRLRSPAYERRQARENARLASYGVNRSMYEHDIPEAYSLGVRILVTIAEGHAVCVRRRTLCGRKMGHEERTSPSRNRPMCAACDKVFATFPASRKARESACDEVAYVHPLHLEGLMVELAEARFDQRLKALRRAGQSDAFTKNMYGFPMSAHLGGPDDWMLEQPFLPAGNRAFGDLMYPFVNRMCELAREHGMTPPAFDDDWMNAIGFGGV